MFPFLGPKPPAGYQRFDFIPISKSEALDFHKYLKAYMTVYSDDAMWLNGTDYEVFVPPTIPEGMEKRSFSLLDPKSAIKVSLLRNKTHLVFAFGGCRAVHKLSPTLLARFFTQGKMISTFVLNLLGFKPYAYERANQIFLELLVEATRGLPGDTKVELVGTCLSASLVSYIGLKNHVRSYCINALPIGAGIQQQLGDTALESANTWITHIQVEGDIVADCPHYIGKIDALLEKLGLRTPGNFGKKYRMPGAYENKLKAHNFAMGSLQKIIDS